MVLLAGSELFTGNCLLTIPLLEKEITVGNFQMNSEERTATADGEEIALTVREFDILFRMLSYPKKTFTRSALMSEFWDYDSSATSRTVDVYMAKLREKTAVPTFFFRRIVLYYLMVTCRNHSHRPAGSPQDRP